MRVRVLACACASTRVCVFEYSRVTRSQHARAVKLLVSGTVVKVGISCEYIQVGLCL